MLFDLRSRRRRGTVRVVYIALAILFGVGLVGFGIGGGFGSGGLFTAATENEGQSAASFQPQIKKYRKLTSLQPTSLFAWEQLTKALLHESGQEKYVTSTGVTSKGKEIFHEAAEAWERYLALNPRKPSTELAQLMVTVYGEGGLNQPGKAVQALQIVVAARPTSASLWASLAQYAYKAHLVGVGDLASAKAVALAPATQRVRVKNELAEVKRNPSGEKTYTTTTNGKVYLVKKAPNGSYTGTLAPTQPPASTTKK